MSGARFVRFYPSDWRSGCMGLSLEQEGFYIRLCSYVFETGLRLPANDSAAAKFMGLHTNAYRKIRNQLVAIGKVISREDGWTVARAEKELAAAVGSSAAGRSSDQDAGRNTRPDTLGESPPETPIDTPYDSGGVFSQNDNENNGPSLEPIAIANSQEEKDDCAREPIIRKDQFGVPIQGPDADVIYDAGTLRLVNGLRAFWLKQFDDDEARLDLALIQAAGYVQRHSTKPLASQVGSQLARIAAEKRDRDERYAKAADAKPATATAPRKNWSEERNERGRALIDKLKQAGAPA